MKEISANNLYSFSLSKANLIYTKNRILMGLRLLAEGLGFRGTSRVLGIKLDTIRKWLAVAALHCEPVSNMLLRDLKLSQVQVDELWTFVKKNHQDLSGPTPPEPHFFPQRGEDVAWERRGSGGPLLRSFVSVWPPWWGIAISMVPADSSARFKGAWMVRSRSLLLTA